MWGRRTTPLAQCNPGVYQVIKTFQTRSGMKFTVEVLEDIGHALVCRVIKGRKVFVGKVQAFAKHDMQEA